MSTLPPDPWKILGVEKSADKSDIRTAYRKLVLKCHPDKVQDPTLKAQKQDEFQKVQQAYELLNDDTERAKYEEQVKLSEMRKAALLSKNMPNISASRTPPRSSHSFYAEVHIAEPRFRRSSPHRSPISKVYAQHFTKSHEDDLSPRSQALYDDEMQRRARRAASYDQPSRRDEEKREERRRSRKDEEDRDRERERERRERDQRAKERKDREKARDKEKKRDVEDKASRRTGKGVYVEEYAMEDRVDIPPKTKAMPSSGGKIELPREKSSSRRQREESPRTRPEKVDPRAEKVDYLREEAAAYIERQRAKSKPAPKPTTLNRAQTFQESPTYIRVPSPPPVPADYVDDDVRRSSARPAQRRASNDLPVRLREKSYVPPSTHKKSRERIEVDALPRSVPSLAKSNSMPPPTAPDSPPQIRPLGRTSTGPVQYSRAPPTHPTFARSNTWTSSDKIGLPDVVAGPWVEPDSDDDRHDSHRRRNRRTRSPEPYRERSRRSKTMPVETVYEPQPAYDAAYDHYDDYPRSSRRHASSYSAKIVDPVGREPAYYYEAPVGTPFSRVKTSKQYDETDVNWSTHHPPAQGWNGVVA